jgi:RecB family exonuclease
MSTEQLGFAGMPQRLYAAAPARLTCHLDCPRRYRMAYLDRPAPPKGPPWAHNSLGAAVHAALAAWWRLPLADRTVPAAGRLLERGWLDDGFRDDAQSRRHRARAREMVERYVADVDPADEPLAVERVVTLRTEHAMLWGRVDRIDDRADGLAVVDYKTGRRRLTDGDARTSLALAVYAAAAAHTFRRTCRRVELHHLPSGDVLAWEHTDHGLAETVRRADRLAAEVARADAAFRGGLDAARADARFPARPGPGCGWCDFNRVCPEGHAARAPLPPWAGLAGEDVAGG